jgi:hypothetical protein
MTLPLLHQVAAAIQPLGPSLVLVGGTAHALFPRHPLATPLQYPAIRT